MPSAGDLVELAVTDQGIGIATADQQRIFERFYRVDAARSRTTGGTGLGLSIVKHVAANHGGEMTVWSEPGRGSTFTLRLPSMVVGRQRDADSPPDGRHRQGPASTSPHPTGSDPRREPHTRRRGRGVLLRPPLVPAAPRGLRGRGGRDRSRRARPVRQERRRPRPARPHAPGPVRGRGLPPAPPAQLGPRHHADRQGQRDRQGRRAGDRRRRLRDQAVLLPGAAGPHQGGAARGCPSPRSWSRRPSRPARSGWTSNATPSR